MVLDTLDIKSDSLEETIYSHGGRFLVILPLAQRIYIDPSGLLSAVYCKHAQLVASTPNLIPYDELTEDRKGLVPSNAIPFGTGMYPAGMTARVAIDRILPNHYLNLESFETVRHWPLPGVERVVDPDDTISEIANVIGQQFRAIVRNGPASLRLTGGTDSRMMLACARDLVGEFDSVTADLNNGFSWTDCRTAKRVARSAGLRHRILEWVEPDAHALELWLYRTGGCAGAHQGWLGTSTYNQFDPDRAGILGTIGGLGRQGYWNHKDSPTSEVDSRRLLASCSCAATPETLQRTEEWKSGIVDADALRLLDLFLVEQRYGCRGGVWTYGETQPLYHAFPMNHRRVIDLMMRLPIELRRAGALQPEIVAREWPELLKYPFNTTTFAVKTKVVFERVIRAAREPDKVYSKLMRKRRARKRKAQALSGAAQ